MDPWGTVRSEEIDSVKMDIGSDGPKCRLRAVVTTRGHAEDRSGQTLNGPTKLAPCLSDTIISMGYLTPFQSSTHNPIPVINTSGTEIEKRQNEWDWIKEWEAIPRKEWEPKERKKWKKMPGGEESKEWYAEERKNMLKPVVS
ncbi:hypothetical protein HRG_012481 [Hirsutella rhossiliensis]